MQIQSLTAKPDQESVQAPQPMAPHGFGPSHGVNCTYCKEAVKGWTAAVLAAPVPFQVGHFVPTALPRLWNLSHGYRPHLLTHSVNPHVLWKVHLTSTYLTVKSETKTSTRCWDFSGSPPSSDLHRNLAYWIHKSSEITSWSHILYLQLHSSYHCTFIHMFPFVCCVFYDWSLILMPKCAPDDQCSNSLQMRLVCVCLCVCGYVFDECGVNGEDLVHVDNPMLLQIVSD